MVDVRLHGALRHVQHLFDFRNGVALRDELQHLFLARAEVEGARQVGHADGKAPLGRRVLQPVVLEHDAPLRRQAALGEEDHEERQHHGHRHDAVQHGRQLVAQVRRRAREHEPSQQLNHVADAALDAVDPHRVHPEAVRDVAHDDHDVHGQHGVARVVAQRHDLRVRPKCGHHE